MKESLLYRARLYFAVTFFTFMTLWFAGANYGDWEQQTKLVTGVILASVGFAGALTLFLLPPFYSAVLDVVSKNFWHDFKAASKDKQLRAGACAFLGTTIGLLFLELSGVFPRTNFIAAAYPCAAIGTLLAVVSFFARNKKAQ